MVFIQKKGSTSGGLMKAIINAKLYDYNQFIENGYIIYDHQIIEVGNMKDFNGHYESYDAKGKLLLPGLLNGHTHIYSTLFRGSPLVANPSNFKEVLDQIWWHFDDKLDLEAIKLSAATYGVESLKNGVTALIDHHASGHIKDSLMTIHHELDKLGMKHLLCFETSDRFDLDACIEENQYALDHHGHFGYHACLSLSDETLEATKSVVGKNPVHIHVAEDLSDELLSKERYGKSVVKRLNDFGLLNKDSILGHCVHIDEEEADIIKEQGCYIAINLNSNLNNAVGLLNPKYILDKDIPVLVGTDGLGVNVAREWLTLYYVMKHQMKHPNGLSFDWLLKTINGSYEYFNRRSKRRIGRFQRSYDADFILVDYDFITPMHTSNVFAHVLFGIFDSLKPYAVFVDGELKVDQYSLMIEKNKSVEIVHNLWGRL
jgi:cytosine/adenosine deaminase-related metal-dependent hydrolase